MKKPIKIVFLDAITVGEVDNLAAISAQAIDKNRLAVTAPGVLTAEPIKVGNPLFKVHNSHKLFITPILPGVTARSAEDLFHGTAENIATILENNGNIRSESVKVERSQFMNIVVLNSSPKGDLSVTLQYVRYAAKKNQQHNFKVFPVAQNIRKLEKDETAFGEVIEAVKSADAVLWAFPLYFLLVCSQYKRFIELIFERNQQAAFQGKYTASLSTSVHFFDHTAHNYIHAICDHLQNEIYRSLFRGHVRPDEKNRAQTMARFCRKVF